MYGAGLEDTNQAAQHFSLSSQANQINPLQDQHAWLTARDTSCQLSIKAACLVATWPIQMDVEGISFRITEVRGDAFYISFKNLRFTVRFCTVVLINSSNVAMFMTIKTNVNVTAKFITVFLHEDKITLTHFSWLSALYVS